MAKSSDKHGEPSAGDGDALTGQRRAAASEGNHSSRITIAFPFSQIAMQEPSKELADLAAVVLDLIGSMAEWIPEERLSELKGRARAVYDELR
jgi:hypothetical protein